MTTTRLKTATRALAMALGLAVLATPALIVPGSTAATQDPKYRKVSPPNVFFPVTGSKAVKDLKSFSRGHRGTDIKAPCGAKVYATHPGTADVSTSTRWTSKYAVRVVSGSGGLGVTSAYLKSVAVTDGQLIQAGQLLGTVGRKTSATACGIYVAISNNRQVQNPSTWLNTWVGKAPPVSKLFGTAGFNVASFNILGASHTKSSRRFATYKPRLDRAVILMNRNKLDVVGTQEFQERQYDYFVSKDYDKTWGAYYWDPAGKARDTENAVIWRKSTMEFVSGTTFDIPYFNGNIRHVPAVLLREKATGRTAYFISVHNPANVWGDATGWRTKAVNIERAKVAELRKTGRPVFLTGDFNDRQKAFCPLTANKLTISPNSVPSDSCAYPRQSSIDWIFAAGQTRFSFYLRDTYAQRANISDHPIVRARAHLQN